MKKHWIETFDRISLIITKMDPIDLIAEGAPEDEYDILALEMFAFIKAQRIDRESLSKEMVRVIAKQFGKEQRIQNDKIRKIADEILNCIQSD